MKKIVISSLFAFSCAWALAQPPVPSNTPTDTTSMQPYPMDTLGGAKQVPNDTSFSSGARSMPTDSTRTRYAQGGKASGNAVHTKKHAARKDTTHVTYSRTEKTVKKTQKQSASTKSKSNKN